MEGKWIRVFVFVLFVVCLFLRLFLITYPFEPEKVERDLYILYFVESHVTPLTWLKQTDRTSKPFC